MFYLGCNRYCLNLGFYRYCRVHDHGTHDPAQFLNYSEYESLLYGEQADANPCVREQLHRRANAVHRHHLLQVCSVHLHLLQHEAGAVLEEGWRNSLALTSDRIIIKSSPGAAVYPDQMPRATGTADVSFYVLVFAINITSVKAFQCAVL